MTKPDFSLYQNIFVPAIDMYKVHSLDALLELSDKQGEDKHLVVVSKKIVAELGSIKEEVQSSSNRQISAVQRITHAQTATSISKFLDFIDKLQYDHRGLSVFPIAQNLDIYIAGDIDFETLVTNLHAELSGKHSHGLTVISNRADIRINYNNLGIRAEASVFDKLDPGLVHEGFIEVDHQDLEAMLHSDRRIPIDEVAEALNRPFFEHRITKFRKNTHYLFPNQFVRFGGLKGTLAQVTGERTNMKADGDYTLEDIRLELIDAQRINDLLRSQHFGKSPRNIEQALAFEMLTNTRYRTVIIVGGAGTGKTFLTYHGALPQILQDYPRTGDMDRFARALITKSVAQMPGQDLGYMPGPLDEKVREVIESYRDAHNKFGLGISFDVMMASPVLEKGKRARMTHKVAGGYSLPEHGPAMEFQAIAFVRGRSMEDYLFIVDEMQNLGRDAAKAILTRSAYGSKTVILGDIGQIDNVHLSPEYNGLLLATKEAIGHPTTGLITLKANQRAIQAHIFDNM